jgi:hypothetical protein
MSRTITRTDQKCEKCNAPADVYAMDKYPGGWAGRYCINCFPSGFMITDYYIPSREGNK